MATTGTDPEICDKLLAFLHGLLPADVRDDLGVDSPLMEMGVLDSLNAARLLNFIRAETGTTVPLTMINAETLRSVRTIAAMIASLQESGQHSPAAGSRV